MTAFAEASEGSRGGTIRLLIHSHFFPPSVGGTESVGLALAAGLSRRGFEVRVLTSTPGCDDPGWRFTVLRQPSFNRLKETAGWADVILHNPVSLRMALASTCRHVPAIVAVHNWLDHLRSPHHPTVLLRRFALRRSAAVVYASEVLKNGTRIPGRVIPNPVDVGPFLAARLNTRHREGLFCAGRLVSDKGFDLAVQALAALHQKGIKMSLRIAGDGPERANLEAMAGSLGVGGAVSFLGVLTIEDLAREMAGAEFFLVPSRWAEPFGIVVVEALAAGCKVIAADSGGLPEAVGGAGWIVPSGDAGAIVEKVAALRDSPPPVGAELSEHLARFDPERVLDCWADLIRRVAA